jgi:hypothetical protein
VILRVKLDTWFVLVATARAIHQRTRASVTPHWFERILQQVKCRISAQCHLTMHVDFKGRVIAFHATKFNDDQMVPETGIEPVRPLFTKRRILSPMCLPISPLGRLGLL